MGSDVMMAASPSIDSIRTGRSIQNTHPSTRLDWNHKKGWAREHTHSAAHDGEVEILRWRRSWGDDAASFDLGFEISSLALVAGPRCCCSGGGLCGVDPLLRCWGDRPKS
jgi:hypothetical protein